MGKAKGNIYTPEQRAAMAERARLLKVPEAESLRLIGEKLGMARVAETLRRIGAKLPKVETAPRPQEPTRQRKPRKQGGGRKPKFTSQKKDWLQNKYSRDLKTSPRLVNQKVAIAHVKKLAKTEFGIDVGGSTLLKQIIRPVLRSVDR